MFNQDNRKVWQSIADKASLFRPSVSKTVTVNSGKHKGKIGIVKWHGVDRYYSIRYKSDAQLASMEINGTTGYAIKILCDNGETFFVKADNVTVK